MGWSGSTPAPDPRIGEAAMSNAAIGREALDWYKDYSSRVLEPQMREEAALNQKVTDQALEIAGDQNKIANETYDYQKGTFRPLEQSIVADATNFSSKDYGDRKAAEAAAAIEGSYSQARGALARDQARMGVAPTAGVSAALEQDMALKMAAAKAGAATGARDSAEQLGFARKMDAASLGRGLPSQQATAAQLALQSGSTAAGIEGQTGAAMRANGTFGGSGFSTAIGANQSAGGILNNSYATYAAGLSQDSANKSQMLGTGVGAVAGIAGAVIL